MAKAGQNPHPHGRRGFRPHPAGHPRRRCKQDVAASLDASIEAEKEKNDFLAGVPAIVQALRDGKIECRAYSKEKFHAKAYITHPRVAVIGSVALVGSSNFTVPGLTQNIELNIQIQAARRRPPVQDWYEQHWDEAENITPDILPLVERHIRDIHPSTFTPRLSTNCSAGTNSPPANGKRPSLKSIPFSTSINATATPRSIKPPPITTALSSAMASAWAKLSSA